MKSGKLLVYNTHGTYGRDDDAYGALLAANSALAKGFEVSMILIDDGTCMATAKQDSTKIGLPNNLEDLQDFIDLDGALYVVKESLEERGIAKEELVEEAQIIILADVPGIIEEHDISLTF